MGEGGGTGERDGGWEWGGGGRKQGGVLLKAGFEALSGEYGSGTTRRGG